MTTTSLGAVATVPGSGLATLLALRRDPLGTLLAANRAYGPIVLLPVPRLPLYLVSDPDAIADGLTRTGHEYAKGLPARDPRRPPRQPLSRLLGQGLLTAGDTQLHRRQRRLIQPLFHREAIAGYAETFVRLTRQATARWRDGTTRDLHHDLVELTLAIVARTIFDVDVDSEVVDTVRATLAVNQSVLTRDTMPGGRLLSRLPLPSNRRLGTAVAELDRVVAGLIAQRRSAPRPESAPAAGDRIDLLSLLEAARDADTGEPMPDRQVRDEALTLLLAGHETTANTLAWTMHLLGANPDAQSTLHDELDSVLCGRPATVADLPGLRFTAAVIHESMRLYPPAWTVGRHLTVEREVCGHRLPARSMLVFSPWVVQRDPRYWPAPDDFTPERWLPPDPDRPRYAYFPFGGGPRQCIGNTFAEMEAILVLATLAQGWRVTPAPGAPAVVAYPQITLRPRDGVVMTLHRR